MNIINFLQTHSDVGAQGSGLLIYTKRNRPLRFEFVGGKKIHWHPCQQTVTFPITLEQLLKNLCEVIDGKPPSKLTGVATSYAYALSVAIIEAAEQSH